MSSPTRPQWEHRCSHHSRCIRMPCEHIPILSTWESRQEGTIANYCSSLEVSKTESKKKGCNQSDQRPTPSFSPCQHCCAWHVQNNTVLPGFGYLWSPWYFPLALTRQSTSTCNKTPALWLLSVTQTRHNAALSKVPWSGTGSTRTWTVSKPNTSNTRHSVGRIDHMISYDSFAVLHVGQKSIKLSVQDLWSCMSHTPVWTAAELATGSHRFLVRNLPFFTDTKLSYQMIKPTVENIRPWDHGKLDQCTLSNFIAGQPPDTVQLHSLHSSLRWWNMMPISVLFPWLNKSVLANEAQWGSLETLWLRSSYVLISCNQNKRRNSQIEFLLKIKAIRTSFVFFLSESNVAVNVCRCDEILILYVAVIKFWLYPSTAANSRTPIWSGWSQRAWNENRGSRYLRWHKLTLPTFIQ